MQAKQQAGKPRVVLIDDHAQSNRVMMIALRMHGFTCKAVETVADALAAMGSFRPDVVLLEWASRFERHVDRARRIRERAVETGRSLAIVVVTHEPERPPADVLAMVDGYLTKPVRLEQLEEAILKLA
jgi:DNA-binding response OmpR family regulator